MGVGSIKFIFIQTPLFPFAIFHAHYLNFFSPAFLSSYLFDSNSFSLLHSLNSFFYSSPPLFTDVFTQSSLLILQYQLERRACEIRGLLIFSSLKKKIGGGGKLNIFLKSRENIILILIFKLRGKKLRSILFQFLGKRGKLSG